MHKERLQHSYWQTFKQPQDKLHSFYTAELGDPQKRMGANKDNLHVRFKAKLYLYLRLGSTCAVYSP